ncbi:pimelyl-ACP methyl ester esterase BioV [Helicobacter pylori]|uniref:pimelyl-ACP methyl ester esterase BioV n=1 Tax=Helicobacter pylori TaxID=210 RepID=UPI0012E7FA24|nr:pimelyl-ACP methyl ester esterase BioV [Helicobacter pylori]MUU52501.1 pimelyl-ACP methyl ester esterase BioV [Helicobacter pylori]
MRFFSGFGFVNESVLFEEWLLKGAYDVSGFSMGAIKAIEYAYDEVLQQRRIHSLLLFSPCMLAHKSLAFKRLQLFSFQKDPKNYMDNFYKEVGLDAQLERFKKMGSLEELEFLLDYKYSDPIIRFLLEKGVKIEVFIGLKDKITDIQALLEFFMPLVQVWQFKDYNHLLQKS